MDLRYCYINTYFPDMETNAVGWQRYNIPVNVDINYKRLDGKHVMEATHTMKSGKSQAQEVVERKSTDSGKSGAKAAAVNDPIANVGL